MAHTQHVRMVWCTHSFVGALSNCVASGLSPELEATLSTTTYAVVYTLFRFTALVSTPACPRLRLRHRRRPRPHYLHLCPCLFFFLTPACPLVQINRLADSLAQCLVEEAGLRGEGGRGGVVAILLPKGPEVYVSMLAIHKVRFDIEPTEQFRC